MYTALKQGKAGIFLMDIKEYILFLNKKVKKYEKSAKNPFLEYNYAYNPFKSAISQTYVWVEKVQKPKMLEEQESMDGGDL